MRRVIDSPWSAVFAGSVILTGLYAGAYFLFVGKNGGLQNNYHGFLDETMIFREDVFYRGNIPMLYSVFAPANAIDRRIRPGYWNVTIEGIKPSKQLAEKP